MRHIYGWLVIAAQLLCTPAYGDETQTYRFRDSNFVPLGSNIPPTTALSSIFPFDRTFSELTPSQQALVRSQYTDLTEKDEPPWPKDGLRVIFKDLNKNLSNVRGLVEFGEIVAVARVGDDGQVASVRMYKTPGAAATSAVSMALFHTEFKPASRNGKPVAMDFLLNVDLQKK